MPKHGYDPRTVPTSQDSNVAVFWERLAAEVDGQTVVLVIPANFDQQHVPLLLGALQTRIRAQLGRDVSVELRPGRGGVADPGGDGALVLRGITEPWPDGAELRKLLDSAFEEMRRTQSRQRRRADELVDHLLRSSGTIDPDQCQLCAGERTIHNKDWSSFEIWRRDRPALDSDAEDDLVEHYFIAVLDYTDVPPMRVPCPRCSAD
jgi:hypothetical protein